MGGQEEKRAGLSDWLAFCLIVIVVSAVWYMGWHLIDVYVVSLEPNVSSEALRGAFGDKFGAINALFSGLAFAGVIFAVLLQRRELALQREELRKNSDRFDEQNAVLNQQRFESTFFKLLDLHNDITSKLDAPSGKGHDALKHFFSVFCNSEEDFHVFRSLQKLDRDQIRRVQDDKAVDDQAYPALNTSDISTLQEALEKMPRAFASYLDENLEMHAEKVRRAYEKACEKSMSDYSHYFRSFYNVIEFLDESASVSPEQKKVYARTFKSQLSDIEIISIFYNAIPVNQAGQSSVKRDALIKHDFTVGLSAGQLIHSIHRQLFFSNALMGGGDAEA